MRTTSEGRDGPLGRPVTQTGDAASPQLERAQWRQVALITAGAVAIFFALRLLPTGTNLSHMDFRVDARGTNAIEFCDPLNPQFIPVVAARSPIAMEVRTDRPAAAGIEVRGTVTLQTANGKPVAPEDLLVVHTQKLHLLIIDPTLTDYQHVHPQPGARPGEWNFAFQPRAAGTYRMFGDFTPAATGRGLYGSTDLPVLRAKGESEGQNLAPGADRQPSTTVDRGGYRFALTPAATPIRATQPIDLRFAITASDAETVPLQPVMGAFAHLVAFDEARSGFAHLHPMETDLSRAPDAKHPALNFKLTIPKAGRYVVWAQVNLGGKETFVPFAINVVE